MFSNEITTITLAMYILQLLILPSQIISYLLRRVDKTRLRYLVFSLSFLIFNSTWIFLGYWSSISELLWESVLQVNGVILLTTTYFYVEKELGIFSGWKSLTPLVFATIFLVFLRWLTVQFTGSFSSICNTSLFAISLGVAIYFTSVSFNKLVKAREFSRNPILVTGIITLCLITISPIVIFFVEEIYIKNLFINLFFLIVSFAYFKQYISQMLIESNKTNTNNYFTKLNLNERYRENLDLYLNYGLSRRECEIAELLLKGMSYQELSEKFNRSYDVMRKHGSNIFKKVGVSNLDQFRGKFN